MEREKTRNHKWIKWIINALFSLIILNNFYFSSFFFLLSSSHNYKNHKGHAEIAACSALLLLLLLCCVCWWTRTISTHKTWTTTTQKYQPRRHSFSLFSYNIHLFTACRDVFVFVLPFAFFLFKFKFFNAFKVKTLEFFFSTESTTEDTRIITNKCFSEKD